MDLSKLSVTFWMHSFVLFISVKSNKIITISIVDDNTLNWICKTLLLHLVHIFI